MSEQEADLTPPLHLEAPQAVRGDKLQLAG